MATLTKAQRAKAKKLLPSKGVNGPSFPVPDKAHARLAIPMATRSERAGNITPAQAASVQAKARAILKKGKTK